MNDIDGKPAFSAVAVIQLIQDMYGRKTTVQDLPGDRDQNCLVADPEGHRFVLKISNSNEDPAFLDAQQQVLKHLADRDFNGCPQVRSTVDDKPSGIVVSPAGTRHLVRMLTFLPGKPLVKQKRQSGALLRDLGYRLGRMDAALEDFDHPAAHRRFDWDLARGLEVVKERRHLVGSEPLRALIGRVVVDFERQTAPGLSALRRSVIHNDANDHNVLVGGRSDAFDRNQTVIGIIDFGDMVYSCTAGNVAVAAAYAVLDKTDPVAAAAHLIGGYHAAHPLTEDEIDALFGLIRLRLCVSACMAAEKSQARPDDPYLTISQQPIRNTLPKLLDTPNGLATAIFREACGLEPCSGAGRLTAWLREQTPAPVLGRSLGKEDTVTLDLSVGSPLLHGDGRKNTEKRLTREIDRVMSDAGATVGVGRYDEARLIYTEPLFQVSDDPLAERRTIHLGLDLFVDAGTPIYAPFFGSVHAVANNTSHQDYGGVLVLEHRADGGDRFYTLYGHLSQKSISTLKPGRAVESGDEIGRLGTPEENGGWTPHLHLQLMVDTLGLGADFPGVARPSERGAWCSLCPDPNLVAGVPADRLSAVSASIPATLQARERSVGPSLKVGYQRPVKLERGWRQYLWDHEGRRYLDGYNNVPHVGHCHPRVVEAAERQMRVLNTNTRYLNDLLSLYADRLSATLPDPLNVCFFVNSASEANELALRLAQAHTGAHDVVVTESAYHGHTTGLIDISPYKHHGPGGSGAPEWVHETPVADTYRGRHRASDPEAADRYVADVVAVLDRMQEQGKRPAAFISEVYPSVGGQIVPPAGYLRGVYAAVRAAGGVAVADEVQTGYGRIGSHFYAFKAQQVVPDIVVLGKPIGNGHPIGAVVTTRDIADSFNNGMEFFSTFGGNTVSCAVGTAVLDVLEEEGLQAHAETVGTRLLSGLTELQKHHRIIGDVRGSGLFLGVELVRDRATLEPADIEASFIVNGLRDRGILIGTDGPNHNVLKVRPPMPFTVDDADRLLQALSDVLPQ